MNVRFILRSQQSCIVMLMVIFLLGGVSYASAAETEQNREVVTMDRISESERNMQKFLGITQTALTETDPDFAAMRDRLIYGEIVAHGTLDDRQRMLITLVTLTTIQTVGDMKQYTEAALRIGVSPAEIKEALYQCAPYIGFPKTEAALRMVNEAFIERHITLPVESQATVTEENRFMEGKEVQKRIFGQSIDQMHASAAEGQKDIVVKHLSAFCFGDIYTRKTLDLKTRELLTFSIVSALGGCEAQVKAHVQGNANVGNSKQKLVDALAQMLPYIGFPRTLNALGCVNSVLQDS